MKRTFTCKVDRLILSVVSVVALIVVNRSDRDTPPVLLVGGLAGAIGAAIPQISGYLTGLAGQNAVTIAERN